jgi:nucleotide-binding universal stress UspA family protein
MEPKRILWPTDFSGSAEKALPCVKSLAEKYNAEIHVLYVIEDIAHHPDWYGNFEQQRIDRIIEWEENKAKERLDSICSNHLEGCPLYVKHIAVGDPTEEILNTIEQQTVDLVVMTTRGRNGQFPFGSVTEKILRSSPIPVVTIPVKGEESSEACTWGQSLAA